MKDKRVKRLGTRKVWLIIVSIIVVGIGGFVILGFLPDNMPIYNLAVDVDDTSIFHHFYGFGSMLGADKMNCNFEYVLEPDARVVSPCNGILKEIKWQEETNDWSILITPDRFVSFPKTLSVNLDHVTNLPDNIKQGAKVKVGDLLGNPGPWSLWIDGVFERMIGRVEIDITKNDIHYPPFSIFDSKTKAEYEAKIRKLIDDLGDNAHNPSVPGDYGSYGAGCWVDKVPESYYLHR